jgi:flagellar hook-associated protein 1 FlgK
VSLNAVLSNALSGLSVAQNALAVTSNNVANANTEGYSRQVAQQETLVIDGRGAGARAADTTRMVDELLSARFREQQSRVGRSGTLDGLHEQIQDRLFGAPGDVDRGLANRISRLAVAAEALATGPDQPGLAAGLIGSAQDFARELGMAGAEVQSLRREQDAKIAATIADINDELAQLEELNGAIGRTGAGPELLDRRDGLLASLAERLEIATAFQDDGTITVYTRSGLPLLDISARQLVYEPAAEVGRDTSFGAIRLFRAEDLDPATGAPLVGASGRILVPGGVRTELSPELRGDAIPDSAQQIVSPLRYGRLQGLLEARDTLLPALADQLGELAGMAQFSLNAAHNSATSHPPPVQLSGTRTDTAAFAAAARSGTAYLAVVDRISGVVAATIAVDVAIAVDAAGLAGQITAGLGGYGVAAVAGDGRLTISAAPGYALALSEGDSAIVATDAAGHARHQGFSHFFGLNDLLVGGGAEPTRLRVRDDLAADPNLLARSKLDVEFGPPLSARLGGAGDDRGAQGLAAAFETPLETVARGDLVAGRFRLADYAAEIVAVRAGAADRAKGAAANDRALADDLTARQAAISGVNLDEELSRLVLYQEAYSISARLVAITNQLFDELLAIVD